MAAGLALLLAGTGAVVADDAPDPSELRPGGAATVRNTGDARAFSQP
jgi:hypothetical protein